MSPDADNALDTKSDKESGAAEEHCEDEKLDQHGNASSSCASISRIVKAFMFSSGGIVRCPLPLKGGGGEGELVAAIVTPGACRSGIGGVSELYAFWSQYSRRS